MTADNSQQIEYWNGPTGQRWAAAQERLDFHLSAIHEALMPFAAAAPGVRVLDVGCGCGTTTFALAKSVAPNGKITGVDISVPMLALARSRSADRRIEFIEADASVCEFPSVYDLIFSRFGVMFFSDPASAFANIRKAVAPGGRLAFVCWREPALNLWASAPMAAARDLLPPQEPMDPHAPGPFAFADGKRLMGILGSAGFREVRIENLDTVMKMGATVDEAAANAIEIGPLSRAAADLDEATRAKIRERVKASLTEFQTPQGIMPPAACWLVAAKI
jgi:SAM-dependent methyltransferase